MISKKTGIIFLLLLTGSAFIGFSMYKSALSVKSDETITEDSTTVNLVDTTALKLLTAVYDHLHLSKEEFLIVGSISSVNGADPAERLTNEEYIFSRKGSSFYFKLGKTETINARDIYIYVNHEIKKILLSKEKNVVPGAGMPDFKSIVEQVKGEGLNVTSSRVGDVEKITLSNPGHLSCKEYAVTFNTLTLTPQKLHIRLTDFSEPENNKRDNVIDFDIQKTSEHAEIEKYINQNIVVKRGGKWVLGSLYPNYELITTL